MAHKKKGLLTFSAEWAKHLRKDMKKVFWSGERSAEKKMMNLEKKNLMKSKTWNGN